MRLTQSPIRPKRKKTTAPRQKHHHHIQQRQLRWRPKTQQHTQKSTQTLIVTRRRRTTPAEKQARPSTYVQLSLFWLPGDARAEAWCLVLVLTQQLGGGKEVDRCLKDKSARTSYYQARYQTVPNGTTLPNESVPLAVRYTVILPWWPRQGRAVAPEHQH